MRRLRRPRFFVVKRTVCQPHQAPRRGRLRRRRTTRSERASPSAQRSPRAPTWTRRGVWRSALRTGRVHQRSPSEPLLQPQIAASRGPAIDLLRKLAEDEDYNRLANSLVLSPYDDLRQVTEMHSRPSTESPSEAPEHCAQECSIVRRWRPAHSGRSQCDTHPPPGGSACRRASTFRGSSCGPTRSSGRTWSSPILTSGSV